MNSIEKLKVKIFADGADLSEMIKLAKQSFIAGLTTNPTLMRKAGVSNYEKFCREVLEHIPNKPLSFEVFSDDIDEMFNQAKIISSWGSNVYVKIPVSNTNRIYTYDLIERLCDSGVKVNVTAVMTLKQVENIFSRLSSDLPSYISIFAGRIADTGLDPIPCMQSALQIMSSNKNVELIWASPRELLNVVQASDIGCHIITVTPDILNKLKMLGYDLDEYSLDTVKMFRQDAIEANYKIKH